MAQKIKGRVINMLKEVKPSEMPKMDPQKASGSGHFAMHCVQAEIPAQILLATGKDHYRKPERGMWDYFIEHGNEGKKPGMTSYLTVGILQAPDVHNNIISLFVCTHCIIWVHQFVLKWS